MRFAVNHRNHAGALVWQFDNLADLKWRYQEGTQGPGSISYSVAGSDPGIGLFANPGVRDPFAPKRTDWELVVDDSTGVYPLMSGPVWTTNFPFSGDVVNVTGLDWLAGLYQPYLGFDYDSPVNTILAQLQAGAFGIHWKASTVEAIVRDLLDVVDPANEIVLNLWTTGSPGLSDGAVWAEVTDFNLKRSDGTTKLSALTQMAQMGRPLGFDFWVDPDKNLHMQGPRAVNPAALDSIYALREGNILDGNWTNNGPLATDVIAVSGGGGSNAKCYRRAQPYLPSIAEYRRWTEFVEADPRYNPNMSDQAQVNAAAESLAQLYRNPQKELSLKVNPNVVDPVTGTNLIYNHVCQPVDVYWTHPSGFHRVDAFFWLTAQEFELGDSGEVSCSLTLDQIYPL